MRTRHVLSNPDVQNAPVPRVTVFIPTYNRASLLPNTIRSVLAQTFGDFRLLVADNASDDETAEVVASFDDPRVEHVRHEENLGMLGNHNWCLGHVETEYSLIISDDDLLYPEHLERTVAALDEHPEAGMVHTGFDVLGQDGETLLENVNWTYGLGRDYVEPPNEFITESMKWSCRVCASTALMRTSALPPDRMRQEDFPSIDFGMWLRMAAAGWKFAFLNETLGAYMIHGESHSAAFGPPTGPGYVQGPEIVSRLREVKLSFLQRFGGQLSDSQRLRRLADESRRRELVVMARNMTLPERKPVPTFRALGQAARTDPRVLLGLPPWKLAAGSLVGPRMVDRIKGLRA
jgi:glycosyltransferase involved in cell wall biosynthesis